MIARLLPQTLPDLLSTRADDERSAHISFLDADGAEFNSFSYSQLYSDASLHGRRLVAAGLTPADVVLASFPDHESHIRLFWACCLAGIPFCPLPALHPDPSRQAILFNHLQSLFHKPTFVAPPDVLQSVLSLVPGFKTLDQSALTAKADESCVFPARVVFPSDTVCFMLTSGSTGNSKAVLLKHSNFLSSVRGKIRHHGSTSASRFFNWIAFDHVACLSEVHIHALEANASQWHVSPTTIVRNPRNLLEFANALGITYTFSPNFLLAQILRDVAVSPFNEPLDLSNVRAIISGGEAVPIGTAIAFTDLVERFGATRDVLRGGFGMSETCAGCTYGTDDIPRTIPAGTQKYLSLGTCCNGVTMRIASPSTGKNCPRGEAGHLQITGSSVFTAYYGNDRATKDSFTEDGWFITGDLAQIDEDGNLFLVGREKDTLNVNGVKHLPQDVERYIEDSNISGVTHSYVYVCPMRLDDADTETFAVFYQHEIAVESDLDGKRKGALKVTNRAIKNACTVMCSQAPHVVLPLPRSSFFKTALGKVSRSQLEKLYLKGEFKAIEEIINAADDIPLWEEPFDLLDPIGQLVANTLAEIFDIDSTNLRRSQNVFDMGATSVHLMRFKQVLQGSLGLPDLPTIGLLKRPGLGDLCDFLSDLVERHKNSGGVALPADYQPLVCLNESGTKPPLFLVHPGVGEILVFLRLASVLNDDRPVYAIRARGFDRGETPFESIDEMSQAYVAGLERVQPNGPYNIAGYSFGAAVAFEMGKELEARGKKVAFFGALNLPPHIRWRMEQLIWVEVLLNLVMFLSLIPESSLDELRDELIAAFPNLATADSIPDDPSTPIQWMFERANKERLAELDLEIGAFSRWVTVATAINGTGRRFEPQGMVKGALTTVFCAIPLPSMGTREEFKQEKLSVWREFSGQNFEMIDVDGQHYTMLSDEHVVSFASHMRGALARAENLAATA